MLNRRHLLAAPAALALGAAGRPRRTDFDVIIIGAGLAGLNAAVTAQAQGARVLVLEARPRVGGRIFTLDAVPGRPEAGANTFADGYGAALTAAATAGVEMEDITPALRRSAPAALFLDGEAIPREAWPTHPKNPLPAPFRALPPAEAGVRALADHPLITKPEAWIDPKDPTPDQSVAEWLAAKGFSEDAIRLAWDTAPAYGNAAAEVSALHIGFIQGWLTRQRGFGPTQYAVKGGNQRLPEGLAATLDEPVQLNTAVTRISQDNARVTITTASGRSFTATRAIVTTPLPALRAIAFEPGLPPALAEAATRLPYQRISIIFLTARRPFWLEDGLSPSMWTNTDAGLVLAAPFGPDPAQPINGFAVHGRGALALRWSKIGPEAAMAATIAGIEALRPAARGLLEAHHCQSWADDPLAGGVWAMHAPGQPRRLGPALSMPHGRIEFAGEHCSPDQRGMEAAASTGVMAAVRALA